MSEDSADLLGEFILEARELLEEAARNLLALERRPDQKDAIAGLFRSLHTIKGTSGIFLLGPLTELGHVCEDLLARVQAGALTFTPGHADALLAALDQMGVWLDALAETGVLPDDAPLTSERAVAVLRAVSDGPSGPADQAPHAISTGFEWHRSLALRMADGVPAHGVMLRFTPDAHCFFRGEDPIGLCRQLPGLVLLRCEPVAPWPDLETLDPFLCNLRIFAVASCGREEVETLFTYNMDLLDIITLPIADDRQSPAECLGNNVGHLADPAQPAAPQTAVLRVEQRKIDLLMSLVGEMVVAKNALAYLARRASDGQVEPSDLAREIKERHALVNRITDEMQAAVMSVRMLPISHVFARFPRLVRDTARRLGKQVELQVVGGETEADKIVVESLGDPLIHLVRNSLDHGIEPPDARLESGKAASATIALSATQENDTVFVRVRDDGRGMDPEAIRRRAVERGIIDTERARAMVDNDALELIFAAGFSTAETVSDLSGRGVGMDVVRRAVEKLGGRVTISSRKGEGSTVELALPLSMAVTRIMVVHCGSAMFGVPMSAIAQTVRLNRSLLHRVGGREAFTLRDAVIPAVRLADLLDLPDAGLRPDEEPVLVIGTGGTRAGLIVSAFGEDLSAIVKPMTGLLSDLKLFSGTTLLGDGRVLLVLDVRELLGRW